MSDQSFVVYLEGQRVAGFLLVKSRISLVQFASNLNVLPEFFYLFSDGSQLF